jgi:osmoprotectant transport system permease protein
LQIVATVAIAAVYGGSGLGRFVLDGIAQNNYSKAIGGAILIIVLALVIDGLYAVIQRFVVPRGVSRGSAGRKHTARGGAIPVVATTRTLIKEGQ